MPAIRIVGGKLKRRKLTVLDRPGLRPTSDRARETVFNWLHPKILAEDCYCLDAFAGTGALGIEAISRGAAYTVFIEPDTQTFQQLNQVLAELIPENAYQAYQASIANWLTNQQHTAHTDGFDLVFLDPPFNSPDLLTQAIALLTEQNRIKPNGWVYLEIPKSHVVRGNGVVSNDAIKAAMKGYELLKSKILGEVAIQLWGRSS